MQSQYFDVITYCADTQALMQEVIQKFPDRVIYQEVDQNGNPIDPPKPIGFNIVKTPTYRNGNETLAVVRVTPEELTLLKQLTNLQILAEVPAGNDLIAALNANPQNRAIYDRVYPRDPIPVLDEQGNPVLDQNRNPVTITPPELIGSFA